MTLIEVTQVVSTAIPVVAFAALFVSLILYVKMRGTVDTLKEAADTYRVLGEAKEAKIDELEKKIDELQAQVVELTRALDVQKQAFHVAIDEFLSRVGE